MLLLILFRHTPQMYKASNWQTWLVDSIQTGHEIIRAKLCPLQACFKLGQLILIDCFTCWIICNSWSKCLTVFIRKSETQICAQYFLWRFKRISLIDRQCSTKQMIFSLCHNIITGTFSEGPSYACSLFWANSIILSVVFCPNPSSKAYMIPAYYAMLQWIKILISQKVIFC